MDTRLIRLTFLMNTSIYFICSRFCFLFLSASLLPDCLQSARYCSVLSSTSSSPPRHLTCQPCPLCLSFAFNLSSLLLCIVFSTCTFFFFLSLSLALLCTCVSLQYLILFYPLFYLFLINFVCSLIYLFFLVIVSLLSLVVYVIGSF